MNCEKAKSLLGWYYDGELNADERDLVAGHVEHCQDCASELAALGQLDCNARQMRCPEPPVELWDRIAQRLAAPGASRAVPAASGAGRQTLVTRRRFAFVAVSVVGGLLTTLLVRPRNQIRPRDPSAPGVGEEPGASGVSAQVLMNLATLDPADRRVAESQQTCAADDCSFRLGTNGPPVKLVLQGTPVFCCCPECELWARAHPRETLAKVETLRHQHQAGRIAP
jgi:anti-sigma factor RsiW